MYDQFPEADRDRQTDTSSRAPAHSAGTNPRSKGVAPLNLPVTASTPPGMVVIVGLMIACCIPMVVIVGVLIATGAADSGLLIHAAICPGAMALMMFAMRAVTYTDAIHGPGLCRVGVPVVDKDHRFHRQQWVHDH